MFIVKFVILLYATARPINFLKLVIIVIKLSVKPVRITVMNHEQAMHKKSIKLQTNMLFIYFFNFCNHGLNCYCTYIIYISMEKWKRILLPLAMHVIRGATKILGARG